MFAIGGFTLFQIPFDMTHDEESLFLPSASSIERLSLCPGSHAISLQAPHTETEYSISGTRIHDLLSRNGVNPPDDFTDEEFETYNAATVYAAKFAEEFNFNPSDFISEQRLFLFDDKGNPIASAKFDRMYVDLPRIALIEWKSGRSEVEAPSSNLQLRTQMVIAAKHMGATHGIGKIIAPWQKSTPPVQYGPEDLKHAEAEIQGIVHDAMEPDAKRFAGPEQCKFCRAKSICQEAHAYAVTLPKSMTVGTETGTVKPKQAAALMQSVPLKDMVSVWKKSTSIVNILKAVDAHLSTLSDEDLSSVGFKRMAGNVIQPISDPFTVWQRLSDMGVPRELFMKSLELSKKPVEDMIRAVTGLKGNGLKAKMSEVLSGCTSEKQNKPSIVEAE